MRERTQLSCRCSWYLSGLVWCSTSTLLLSMPTASHSPVGQYPREKICSGKRDMGTSAGIHRPLCPQHPAEGWGERSSRCLPTQPLWDPAIAGWPQMDRAGWERHIHGFGWLHPHGYCCPCRTDTRSAPPDQGGPAGGGRILIAAPIPLSGHPENPITSTGIPWEELLP